MNNDITVDILYKDLKQNNHYDSIIRESCIKVLEYLSVIDSKSCEISILITSDINIKELNKEYRGKNSPTNVLSFPLLSLEEVCSLECLTLGDIVISIETLDRESKEQEKSFDNHLTHMVTHSMLHLLGYDHINEKERIEMESLEIEILKKFNIDNPYIIE